MLPWIIVDVSVPPIEAIETALRRSKDNSYLLKNPHNCSRSAASGFCPFTASREISQVVRAFLLPYVENRGIYFNILAESSWYKMAYSEIVIDFE